MTSNLPCKDCVSGFVHSGTPIGTEQKIHGFNTYVATPPDGLPPKAVVVIISDAFGWKFVNSRVLADSYASKGQFLVYLPDFTIDGGIDDSSLTTMARLLGPAGGITGILMKPVLLFRVLSAFLPWLYRNRASVTMPSVIRFFTALRANETLPVGVAGFCWGGKHTVLLTHPSAHSAKARPLIDAAFTAHPSGLAIPGDIHPVIIPLSIAIGDKDMALNMKGVNQIKDVLELKGAKGEVAQEVRVYAGAKHGFATRGNPNEEKEDEMATRAEDQAVDWFKRFLISEVKVEDVASTTEAAVGPTSAPTV